MTDACWWLWLSFVLGPDAAVAACSAAVRIPITDKVESLNAGVAGSVLLWHFRGAGR